MAFQVKQMIYMKVSSLIFSLKNIQNVDSYYYDWYFKG